MTDYAKLRSRERRLLTIMENGPKRARQYLVLAPDQYVVRDMVPGDWEWHGSGWTTHGGDDVRLVSSQHLAALEGAASYAGIYAYTGPCFCAALSEALEYARQFEIDIQQPWGN